MSPMLLTFLFAASAAAQVTTSIWMPSSYDNDEVGFYGSVIDVANDKTTIALKFDDETDTEAVYNYRNSPETITVAGSTWFESVATTTQRFENGDLTYSVGCSVPTKSRAKPTCTYSMGGELAWKSYCGDYSSYSDAYTTTYAYTYSADRYGPASTETYVETIDYRSYIPDVCASGSTLPESYAVSTITLSSSYIEQYRVVVTAGQEKLVSASAGATITGTSPSATGAQQTGTATGSVSGSAARNSTLSATGSPSVAGSAPPDNTGAAPMITAAPVLAFGAAVAAFVL